MSLPFNASILSLRACGEYDKGGVENGSLGPLMSLREYRAWGTKGADTSVSIYSILLERHHWSRFGGYCVLWARVSSFLAATSQHPTHYPLNSDQAGSEVEISSLFADDEPYDTYS